ncbi:MAG: GNAT family N-acetyltransferase [Planctomycetaceae bacterium]
MDSSPGVYLKKSTLPGEKMDGGILSIGVMKGVTIWPTVDAIDANAWEQVRHHEDVFMDLRMLRITERSLSHKDRFWYLLICDDAGQPCAILCAWQTCIQGTLLADESLPIRGLKLASKIVPALNTHPILFCGMPVSAGQSNLRIKPGASAPYVIDRVNSAMEYLAGQSGARFIVFKEFTGDESRLVDLLKTHGYLSADSLPMNEHRATATSFEGFLAKHHKKKRWDIRKTRKQLQDRIRLHVTTDPLEVKALYSDDVHRLYEAVLGKSEHRLETLSQAFFQELSAEFGDDSIYCFLMDGTTVLAFGNVLVAGKVAYAMYVGVNYSRNAEYSLYFNIMYALMQESLNRNVELVSWGQTVDEFKRSKLLCSQSSRSLCIKGTSLWTRLLITSVFSHLFPRRVVEEFRDEGEPVRRAA